MNFKYIKLHQMKTIKLFVLSLCILSLQVKAQEGEGRPGGEKGEGRPGGEKREKVEAMKIGFITQKLDLTPEEARVFWPVYNQMSGELEAIRKNRRSDMRDAKDDFSTMSDKDVEKLVDNEIVSRQNELDILKKYHSQFKKILPIKKVALLYRAEEEFKRHLLNEIRNKGGDKQGKGNHDRQ